MDQLWDQTGNLPEGGSGHRVPVWVVPRWHELRELVVMAEMTVTNPRVPTGKRLFYGGMVDATGWVLGRLFGPVTGRDEVPVTFLTAQFETAIADCVLRDEPLGWVSELCEPAGVKYWPPLADLTSDQVRGARMALRWLTGVDETPPLPVPLRNPDGALVTASQMYDSLLRREPQADAGRRLELRRQAAKSAEESYAVAKAIREHLDQRSRRG
jgi:hypothetical protein